MFSSLLLISPVDYFFRIYSCPVEWPKLYEEYLQKVLDAEKAVLRFCRSDDGYLRAEGAEGVYLKVTGLTESLSHAELSRIGQKLSEQEEELSVILGSQPSLSIMIPR